METLRDNALDTLVVTNQHIALQTVGTTAYIRISDSPCSYEKFDRYPRWLRAGEDLYEKRGFSWDGPIYAREVDYVAPVLDTVAVAVAKWTKETFPETGPEQIAKRVLQEGQELLEVCGPMFEEHPDQVEYIGDECADVLHCLIDLCSKLNIDLAFALNKKLVQNHNRIWPFVADAEGQRQHVKPSHKRTRHDWCYMFGFPNSMTEYVGGPDLVTLPEFAAWVSDQGLTAQFETQWKEVLAKLARPPFVGVQ